MSRSNSAASSNSDDVKCRVASPWTVMSLYCGFCGKSNSEVDCLVAGPSAFICDECTFTCSEIVEGFRIRLIVEREVEAALAQRIEARSDETAQPVQPEGREPGSEGMRAKCIGIETEQE